MTEEEKKEEEQKEPEQKEESEEETETSSYVTHDEFNAQQQLVEDISGTLLDIQETVKKLVPVPSKEGETPVTPEQKDTTPVSPDIKIDNPIEYLYVRKRGGRVVRREVKK